MSNKWITPKDAEEHRLKVVECCSSCKFYWSKTCRRYPKQQGDYFPISPGDWCGEYKAK